MAEDKMQAITFDRFADPSVLKLVQLPIPKPKNGEVLVKIHAAGNHDTKQSHNVCPAATLDTMHNGPFERFGLNCGTCAFGSGVNPVDCAIRGGKFFKLFVSKPKVPGAEVAGVIEQADGESKVSSSSDRLI